MSRFAKEHVSRHTSHDTSFTAAAVGRVACVGAPLVSAACSLRVLLAKRKERRGEGLGLLLHASVARLQQQPCLAQKHSLQPWRDQEQPAPRAGGQ